MLAPRSLRLAGGLALTIGISGLTAGCGPKQNPALEALRADIVHAQADPVLTKHAPAAVDDAVKALARADTAQHNGLEQAEVDHTIYLARRRLEIAQVQSKEKSAEEEIARIGAQRERDVANARVDNAELRTAVAQGQAATARSDLQASQQTVDEQRADARTADMTRAALELDLARLRRELDAKQTERGLMFTFSDDVLFDVGRSNIKAGARQRLDRLSAFLTTYPDRHVRVDGYTDSTGGVETNLTLSRARADAVRTLFIGQGVEPGHVVATGFGSDSPVASNDSSAGREQNRRVEVVLLNPSQTSADAGR